ncbi:DoxX family protein [Actinokineospora auranticolor]|uniref:Putative oxidoreductase n=1 Tax=Actinokineospora auranticolor TaxID=155976 RepID=A0A2S6GSL0_9PSEU|nr:DoxX family protein [Actinokineospora auranticolor]PPK68111.1 putative oxidoreductase [Actinokineospora auranticolor]
MDLLHRGRAHVLALFRIVIGFLFAVHGAATLFGVFGGAYGKAPAFAEWPGWWAAVIQLVGGVLVLIGLGTRVAALICSGSMAYAYFVVHQQVSLLPNQNGGEVPALFCWSFLLVVFLGPGKWAVDEIIGRTRHTDAPERESVTT